MKNVLEYYAISRPNLPEYIDSLVNYCSIQQNIGLDDFENGFTQVYSEGGYGIDTQVEKQKKMTIVNFMEYDLNQQFLIFVDSSM